MLRRPPVCRRGMPVTPKSNPRKLQRLAQLLDLALERAAIGRQIGTVHHEIAPGFRPGNLLLQAEPEMDAGADLVLAGDAEDGADRLVKARMLILLRNAEAARQIVWANQHRVQAGDGANLMEVLHGRNAFDVGDEDF